MEKLIISVLLLVIIGLLGYLVYDAVSEKPQPVQPTQIIVQPTSWWNRWWGYEPRYPGYWKPDYPHHHNEHPKPEPKPIPIPKPAPNPTPDPLKPIGPIPVSPIEPIVPKPIPIEGFADSTSWKEINYD